jgi:hypothetical protein
MAAHAAIPWEEDGRRECRVCGGPITPADAYPVLHSGEQYPPTPPLREDAPGFAAALKAAEAAMTHVPNEAGDDDKMRAVVEGIYRAGLITRRPRRTTRPAHDTLAPGTFEAA